MHPQTRPDLSDAKRQLLNRILAGKTNRASGNGAAALERPRLPRRASGNIAPQSLNQEQVWTHCQMMGAKPAYNELITIHRRGKLDVRALERSLDELNRRHEIWRTTFEMGEQEPLQIIHDDPPPVKLRAFDLRTLPQADRARESERLACADGRAPFNLTKLPLWRAVLVRVADEEFHLHMNLHQLVLDGVTVYRILLPELIAIYEAFSRGLPSPLPEPAAQYADFAVWQRTKLTSQALRPHLNWWKQNLSGELPKLTWPGGKPRPAVQTYAGATEMLFLPGDVTSRLRGFAESESATLFMALAAGFFTLMQRYTGQTDLILGMPSASRSPETEGIMGYFLNLLPLRVDLAGNPSFRQVLLCVRGSVVDALEHGSVPLLRLLEEVRPARDESRNPIFQIMISLEPPMPAIEPAWDLTQAGVSSGSTKMDMYLNLDTRPDGLMAPIMYNPDLLEAATVRRMFADWQAILSAGVETPDAPIASLPLPKPPAALPEPPTVTSNHVAKPSSLRGKLLGWLKR